MVLWGRKERIRVNKKFFVLAAVSAAFLAGVGAEKDYGLDIGKPCPQIAVTWQDFNKAPLPLKEIGRIKNRTTKEIADSPWSVGTETLERNFADFEKFKDYYPELGVKRARLMSGWSRCEKKPGVYDFKWLDPIVYGLKERGVKPWMCICYGNPIYKSDVDLGAKIFSDPKTVEAWGRYVTAIVSHYKDAIEEWEIWNEPNHRADPIAFATLTETAAKAIRKVKPDAVILAFTVHGAFGGGALNFPKAVWAELKKRGSTGLIDYVTYHPYTPLPEHVYSEKQMGELRAAMKAVEPQWNLYQGESGCPSQLEWGHAMNKIGWTEYSQPKWILRRMLGDWTRGIRTSVFTMVDLQYQTMLQSFGLLRCDLRKSVVYKRPSFYAVRNVASLIDSTVKPEGVLKVVEKSCAERVEAAAFSKEGRLMLGVWFAQTRPGDGFERKATDVTLECGIAPKDLVAVELVTGKVMELPAGMVEHGDGKLKLKGFPMWDSPTLLMERVDVALDK